MTNRKAIEILREKISPCLIAGEWKESVDVAISALQAQDVPDINVGDMVSRQKAIDALCKRCDLAAEDDEPCTEKCNDIKILEKLPSVQPEIIRCKDCKWWGNDDFRECLSPNYDDRYVTRAGFYCGYAERRTDD